MTTGRIGGSASTAATPGEASYQGRRYFRNMLVLFGGCRVPSHAGSLVFVVILLSPTEENYMELNRRQVAKSALLGAAALVVVPASDLFTKRVLGQTSPPTLDAAVLSAAQQKIILLANQIRTQSQTASTVAATETALSTLFAEMSNIGYNSYLAGTLPGAATALQTNGVNWSLVSSLVSQLQASGMVVTEDDAYNTFAPVPAGVPDFLADLSSIGVSGIEQNQATGVGSVPIPPPGGGFKIQQTAWHPRRPRAHFERVAARTHCAELGIEAGVLGLFSPPGLDLVFGAAGVIWATMGVLGLC
jgi:hypothetical protein